MNNLFQGTFFLIRLFFLYFWERVVLYSIFQDQKVFIRRITTQLAQMNILYVKIFQAIALNHQWMDPDTHHELHTFTDDAPWTEEDIDADKLAEFSSGEGIFFQDGFYSPIKSGMISLVYKTYLQRENKSIIIKIKRS
jgi:predicted unusual protein kinase regulating ubiquinone biosynthesis (AarF/ABC1/UbiB family)